MLGSGLVLGALGVATIALLPWPVGVRAMTSVAWASLTTWELLRLRRAWADCRALRFGADGCAWALDRHREWRSLTVLPGSILLRRYGWIRLQPECAASFAEPLRGACRESADWRRLQVIWRHVGATE